MLHFLRQPRWLGAPVRVAQEMKDVYQSWSGNNALVAHVSKACRQVTKKVDLEFVPWAKISVSTFARRYLILIAIPNHPRFAQPSSRRNHCLIAARVPIDLV